MTVLSAFQSMAQENTVSLNFTDTPITEVLREIKRQTGIKLAYDARALREVEISIKTETSDVEQALGTVLQNSGYEAVFIKKTWLVIPLEIRIDDKERKVKRNFRVSGRLVDSNTGEPLPYANISLQGRSGGAMSNLDGYFSMPSVSIDTIPLCISYVGYRSRCVDLAAHETENMAIKMERANTYLLAVDVIGKQNDLIASNPMQDMLKMDATGLSRMSSQAQPDLFKSVQMLPGVSSGDALDSQLHIRGGEEDENLVLWDGFTLYHLDHFFGVFSTLNPSVIQDINLYKGPYGSRYGARSGGVLDVIGKSGNRKNPNTRIDMNLINAGILTEGPVGKNSSYLISFRRSHTDIIQTGFYDDLLDGVFDQSIQNDSEALIGEGVESEFFYHDLNMKWNSEIGRKDRLSLSLFNGGDRFQRSSWYEYDESGTPWTYRDQLDDDSRWVNTGVGAVWTRNHNPSSHSYTSLGFSEYKSSYYFSDEERGFFNGLPKPKRINTDLEENHIKDVTLHHRRSIDLEDGGNMVFGYQYTHLILNTSISDRIFSLGTSYLADSTDISNQHSLFLDRTWRPKDGIQFRAGGRLSSNSFTDKLYIEPRLRIDWQMNSEMALHLASGNYIQQIRRVAEQDLFIRQADRWEMSDGELIPESRTFHSEIGFNYTHRWLNTSVEFFYKRTNGVILNQEQNRTLSSFTAESEGISSGKGTALGFDLLLNLESGAHNAWLSYSYTESANTLEDINNGTAFPSAYNKPHDLKAIYQYKHRDYLIHSQVTASSGYPYTEVLGLFEGPGGDIFIAYDQDLLARLPAIFRWDISVSRTLSMRHNDITIGLGVYNLTDHQNIRSRTYAIPTDRDGQPEDLTIRPIDLELLGLSPTFSVVLEL